MCNMGSITETATAFPGQTGQRPNSVAPLAEMLRLNGFATAAFGKSHETAAWEVSTSGPDQSLADPLRLRQVLRLHRRRGQPVGADDLRGMNQVEPPKDPNYHFLTDMTDQAIDWTKAVKSLTPEKPFFIYFAPGATHAPHHVPKEWIAKYKGKFDQGWDKLREETLARQKKLGVVPPDTKLAPKPAAIKDWDKLTADEQKLFAHQMEVFAGYGEFADHEVGRLVQAIEDLGQMDNTLDLLHRRRQRRKRRRGHERTLQRDDLLQRGARKRRGHPEALRRPGRSDVIRPLRGGVGRGGDTPFTWTKQVAANYGGTRNGMVVHWPRRIKARRGPLPVASRHRYRADDPGSGGPARAQGR